MQKKAIDPGTLDPPSIYKIMAGSIVPRPIALTSTISAEGVPNLAPFSFFNMICNQPPLVSIAIGHSKARKGPKDSLVNIQQTMEFVVNLVSEELAEAQDRCAGEYGADVDEFVVAGLTPVAARMVRPPLVKESLVNFECRVVQIVAPSDSDTRLVIGRICMMHVDGQVLQDNGRIDLKKLRPVGRLAGNAYCHVGDAFTLNYNTFDRLRE
jgi:flavin reductase (DIM6/NTAB) family NADH-FMN oxidoreductase RutF